MKVCIVQHDIEWQRPAENVRRIDVLMSRLPQADLYVLPEMWATGFGDAPVEAPEAEAWMMRKAREMQAAVAGSLAVRADGRWTNRLLFVLPDGCVYHYDKHHLFAPGGETDWYVPGSERVVVEWKGVRWLLQVCYDLRFPVWSRNREDYDAVLYVANWPRKRRLAWDTLLRARAIENQCYVVGVNRVGCDPHCDYDGGSMMVDAYGRTIATGEDCKEGFAVAQLDMEALRAFRKKFPVLKDRDLYEVKSESGKPQ